MPAPTNAARPLALFALVACLLTAGCRSAPTRFYVLTPLPAELAAGGQGLALGIDPVRLPTLLDRPNIVTRIDDNERRLAEFGRWAEPLDENVSRVLAENLSALLGSERVVRLPTVRVVAIDRRLSVDVLRFDATPGGDAVLEVRWRLFEAGSNEPLLTRHETFVAATGGDDDGALVAAMSAALADLSRAITGVLQQG